MDKQAIEKIANLEENDIGPTEKHQIQATTEIVEAGLIILNLCDQRKK